MNEDEIFQIARMFSLSTNSLPEMCTAIIEKWGLKYCLVTLGERGAFAQSADDDKIYVPGYNIKLVDSIGADDAFSAGFVHKILHGSQLLEACSFGNTIGAIVATRQGCTKPISEKTHP